MEQFKKPQDIVKQILFNAFVQGQSHHLYILVAPNTRQQQEIYQWFLQLHVCTNRQESAVCETCSGCKQVLSENYMNSVIIRRQAEKKSLGVEDAQALQQAFMTTAGLDAKRFFCIEDADKMTVQAANSILKFLEEPLADVSGFLFVANEHKLLPTITSRGQILRLGDAPLAPELVAEIAEHFPKETYQKAAQYLCMNNYDTKIVFKQLEEMMQAINSYASKIAVGSPVIVAQTELEQFATKSKTGAMILDLLGYITIEHLMYGNYFREAQHQAIDYMRQYGVEIFLSIYDALQLTKTHASVAVVMTKFSLGLLAKDLHK